MRDRDNRRQKLYDAERAAKMDARPMTLWECEVYAKNALAWAVKAGLNLSSRNAVVGVVPGNRTRATCLRVCGGWRITLPPWAQTRWVVLHEVAHCLPPKESAAHGWEFAAGYLKLVEHFLGAESAKRLKAQFKAERVRYRPPVSRPISPERRAELVARLAACRQQPKGTVTAKSSPCSTP